MCSDRAYQPRAYMAREPIHSTSFGGRNEPRHSGIDDRVETGVRRDSLSNLLHRIFGQSRDAKFSSICRGEVCRGEVEVVSRAVPRCTAQASATCAGVLCHRIKRRASGRQFSRDHTWGFAVAEATVGWKVNLKTAHPNRSHFTINRY